MLVPVQSPNAPATIATPGPAVAPRRIAVAAALAAPAAMAPTARQGDTRAGPGGRYPDTMTASEPAMADAASQRYRKSSPVLMARTNPKSTGTAARSTATGAAAGVAVSRSHRSLGKPGERSRLGRERRSLSCTQWRKMNGAGSDWVSGFERRLPQPQHLMFHGLEVDNHAPHPRRRCHVEVVAMSAKASMTVPMNVRPERIHVQELTQRAAPDVDVAKTRIQNAQSRTVRHKYCFWSKAGRQVSEIDSNVSVWFLKSATHEWQGILIADDRKRPRHTSRPWID